MKPAGSRAARGRSRSLAALLHEAADELLGVGLEHLVDVVEDRVDVVVELLLALGGGVAGADSSGSSSSARLARGPVLLATFACHRRPPAREAGEAPALT